MFGLLLFAAGAAQAGSVYKCTDVDRQVAYQDHPCSGAQQRTAVELAPAPPPAPSPDYAVASSRTSAFVRGPRHSPRASAREEPRSYECRAANGEVFYRHSGCPKSITDSSAGRRRRGAGSSSVGVSAVPLTRSDACKRLAAAGSVGRDGRERDERVSTYERNAGRDPCRRY